VDTDGKPRARASRTSRGYDASRRREQADLRRERILHAARELFAQLGYPATTMAAIAARADVAVDTVYASVGSKPALFKELVETAISGTGQAVPAEQRDYVQAIRAEPDAAAKLRIYASALIAIHARLAPLLAVVQAAAFHTPEIARLWNEIAQRRAANMRLLAADLAGTGQLRPDLTLDEVADIIWATNSAEFYLLLVRDRGWDPDHFARFLADTWCRLLLTA
jgi:AcrR family transcriptional regulator